ncbi:hypothetical protein ACXYX3_06560 [Mycobacterium sp. C3-094]
MEAMVELERRGWHARLAIGAIVGLILGAVLGALAFSPLSTATTATAFIRITPPADLTALAGGAQQTTPNIGNGPKQYVSGEVAYLSGEGFAKAIGDEVGLAGPAPIIVSQAQESAVVSISNRSATPEQARRVVQTAIDIYNRTLARTVDGQLQTVLPALDQWQRTNAADGQPVADIAALRQAVLLQSAQAEHVDVVQPPTLADQGTSRWLIGAQLGGLLGAAVVILALMARSRRAGHPFLVEQIAQIVDGIVIPAVNTGRSSNADRGSVSRTLYTHCAGAVSPHTIAVLGTSPRSQAPVVAAMLESVAAERGSTNSAHIVDAGATGPAQRTQEALRTADTVVVVTKLNGDTAEQALTTCTAARSGGTRVLAVFTYQPWWTRWASAWRRRSPRHAGGTRP